MYIVQRHQTFLAYHDIPADVQKIFGRRRFKKSLDTNEKSLALVRAAECEAKWRAAINNARGQKNPDWNEIPLSRAPSTDAEIERQATSYRDWAKEARSPAEHAKRVNFIMDRGDDIAYDIDGIPMTYSEPGEEAESREGYQAAARFIQIATGELVKLTEHLDAYLATLKGKNRDKTVDVKKSTIEKKFALEFPYIADVNRKSVQKWVNAQARNGVALATIRRGLSELRGYWTYLQSIDAASEGESPFDKLSFSAVKKADRAEERRAFEPEQILKLRDAAFKNEDKELGDLIEIAMWTGARIEEMCALKSDKVNLEKKYIEIVDAKTSASWRQVPIHSKLMPTMRRLVKESRNGFVISNLSFNKYGDRSNAVGKRFGLLKIREGFGPQYVFHSIRKTVATLLENAGIPEGVAADILGHEKATITYGLYSGGASLELKHVAIEKLSYSIGKTTRRH